jgi:UDP-N-acetylmuramoylalanine--D-glutamate ligase
MSFDFKGLKVVIIGIARSGTAMAQLLAQKGAIVHAVDAKPADSITMLDEMDKLTALGVEVTTSWTGNLDWETIDLIAPSPGVPPTHPTLREAIERGIPIWSEIEIAYKATKAPIIAITGTNGKTTVTAMTWHILSKAKQNAILCGNIAGTGLPEMPLTKAALIAKPQDTLVAEISSYQLDWIDEFKPHSSAITNITNDHLERYGVFEEYRKSKLKIYKNQTKHDYAVINTMRKETFDENLPNAQRLTIGPPKTDCDAIINANISYFAKHQSYISLAELSVPGEFNLINATTAILLSTTVGVEIENAISHVKDFHGTQHRLEFIAEHQGIKFVNNSMCTNPEALRNSISAIKSPLRLIAGGLNKDDSTEAFRGICKDHVKAAYLYGRDAKTIAQDFKADGCESHLYESLDEAFLHATRDAAPEEIVLLAPGCASQDQFEDFIERGNRFRMLVHQYMEQNKR